MSGNIFKLSFCVEFNWTVQGTYKNTRSVTNVRFRGAYILHHQGNCPDDWSSTHLWNVGLLPQDYTALYPRKLSSSTSQLNGSRYSADCWWTSKLETDLLCHLRAELTELKHADSSAQITCVLTQCAVQVFPYCPINHSINLYRTFGVSSVACHWCLSNLQGISLYSDV
jgi:hypothetical protein